MKNKLEELIIQLASVDITLVEDAVHKIVALRATRAVPHLMALLKTTENHLLRNTIAIALRDLKVQEAVPIILYLVRNLKIKNYQGTLVYSLQTLDCKEYVVEISRIICEENFECREMALSILEGIEQVSTTRKKEALQLLKKCLRTCTDPHQSESIECAIEVIKEIKEQ